MTDLVFSNVGGSAKGDPFGSIGENTVVASANLGVRGAFSDDWSDDVSLEAVTALGNGCGCFLSIGVDMFKIREIGKKCTCKTSCGFEIPADKETNVAK